MKIEFVRTGRINKVHQCAEKNQTPVPGGLQGWTNMKIVDAACESSQTGKVVKIQ